MMILNKVVMWQNFDGILLFVGFICYSHTVRVPKQKQANYFKGGIDITAQKKFNFSEYLKRFEPRTVWEHLDKQRKYQGRKLTDQQQTDLMCKLMDPADEILKLKVENGDPKMVVGMGGRRGWKPPKGISTNEKDRFFLRRRLFELMKQAIYQTRDKMVIMQIYREKYNKTGLYRMGFLMNKADNAAKAFGSFSFRSFKSCLLSREHIVQRIALHEILTLHERQLSILFNLELLVDLIKKNDEICKDIFKNQTEYRGMAFDNQFIP